MDGTTRSVSLSVLSNKGDGTVDIDALKGLAVALVIVVLILRGARDFYWAMKSANSAMDEWPWWWPKSDRHYNPPR